jgi:adenosylhomocysteinase
MDDTEYWDGLAWVAAEPADVISDMGGELLAATVSAGYAPLGGLEATTSGLHRLADVALTFPVFNWNNAELKDRVHNRHHVGLEMWPMFSAITGLAVHGRPVLVVGFGPVGRGVAIQARSRGAVVSVADLDPVRRNEAQQYGCRVVTLEEGLVDAGIVVTATGVDGVIGPDQLGGVRDGVILCNVGHTNREIDLPWLDGHPHRQVRRYIERYEVDGKSLFLLNRGSLLNLAAGVMPATDELFDPFSAMILHGIMWILEGGAAQYDPGLHPYPKHLEHQIASAVLDARR